MSREQITTTIDGDLLKRLKIQAIKEGKKLNSILEKLIEKYLKEVETH
jgi:predicted DNA-binding protein